MMFYEEKHSIPRRFQFIRKLGDFGDVVRQGYVLTTCTRKDRQITGGRQVGAEQALLARLQFDTQESVMNLDAGFAALGWQCVRTRAEVAYALAINIRQPGAG